MEKQNDIVFLIHGLGGSRLDMWPLARRLKQRGFKVTNWGYRSLGNRIETHARRLGDDLVALDNEGADRKVHVVCHSMGGIITRAMLADFEIRNLGRIVMLAPPNQGSHAARKLTRYIGWLTPSLGQLSDSAHSFVNRLPNSLRQNEVEFGIVESTKDRVIAQGGVHLEGLRDYARVKGHHGVLPWYSKTIRLVETFLISGKFEAELSGERRVAI